MTSVFDKLDVAPSLRTTIAPDPRIDPRIIKTLRRRSIFHTMQDDLENDTDRSLIPGVRERARFRGRATLDRIRPAISDAIADLMAMDPNLRAKLERDDVMAQAGIAEKVMRRTFASGHQFEAPDFLTVFKEEVAKRVAEPTVGEKVSDIGTTLVRVGLSMAATTEAGIASVTEAVSKIPFLPQAKLYKFLSEGADLFSRDMMRIIQRHAQGDPRLESNFLWRTLPESVGSFGGFILITAGATALGGPAAGIATAATMATTMGVGESRQRRQLAIQSGALSPNEGQLAELNGALPGIIQILPVMRALRLMGPKASLVLRRGIRQYATDGVETALEEALVETLGELGQDAIEKWNFDPKKVIGETAIETAKASGAGGFVVGLATSAIRGVRLGRYRKPPDGGDGFTTEDARRIMADALALEQAARRHIDEAATDDRPAQRQALDLLRVNITNLEFVKRGREKIVAMLMERFGLSKRKASRMYTRVKSAYEIVKLAERADQPAGLLRQAEVMLNEALTEPDDPATPQTVDQPIPPERNTFAQGVRQDLYREFRNELTELDVVEEPLGATLPRGVPARFLVGEGGETLPIPLSPFPVTDRAEVRELGLAEHRESISFRAFRLMDLFEANTLAELLQEANPRDAFAVFKAGEDDWRVFFKQAEVTTLFEQEPSRGEEAIQEGPEGPEGPGPGPAGVIAAGPEAPPGGPGVAGGAVAGPVGAAAEGVAGRIQDAAAVAAGRREPPGPGQEPAGRRRERIAPPPIAPAVANVVVKFDDIRALIEDAGREFPSAIDMVHQRLQTVDVSGEPSAIDFFALHPDALDGLSAVDKLRVSKQFSITEDADAIADVVGAVVYEQAVQEALTAANVRDNLHRIADILLSNPKDQDQNQVLAALIFQDRDAVDAVQRRLGRDHYRADQLPVGATFELFGVPFEIAEHDGIRVLLHTESNVALPLRDVSILIPVDRGTLQIRPDEGEGGAPVGPAPTPPGAPGAVEGGQPGLLGEQFAGPITGRQAELPLPIPSPVELEVEADAARSRRELAEDESAELFPQDVANPVPFDDALETAPDGLEFTGTAMPEGDIRAELLLKFEEEPAEALLFAEAMGIKNADKKSPAEIIDEFWATKEEALKDDDGPADVIPMMLYSGIPIPDHLPAGVVKGAGEFVKPVISIAFVDLVDRLRRVSDNPLIQQAADAARLATLDAKAFIGELSALLDPVLRMTGKHALTEEGKATQRLQQIQWDDNGEGGVSIFHLALEDKLPPGVTITEIEQQIIDLGKSLIALGGQLHEREGTMRFNHRTGEWEPFQQIGRAVAPRISTLELLDLVAQGEGGRFDLLVRLIAENPDNRALLLQRLEGKETTPEEEVRRILLEQRDEMTGASGDPSAFRRINAEFARIWPYFPTMIHDPVTGARVQLIENNPFHYFERYVNLTAGRLAYIRHFGQELEKPSLVNQLVDIVQKRRGGSDEVIAVTRALHGMPVERTFWTQPGSAPHQFGIGLRHASSVLKAGALSMTWPQNLLEPLGRILGLAGGPMKRDMWVALGNLYGPADERRAATLSTLRSLGAVDHWIRNLSIDPNRPGESAARMLREIPTVLVRIFWKEQSRLAAAVGLAKAERMAAGRGTRSDRQDIEAMLGFDRETAEAMTNGEGTPEQYLMIARRAGAYTTNQPMVKAEQSRLEHSRIFRLMFAFTTYGFMGVRWLASNLRVTMPIMRNLWRNPKSKEAWNEARVNVTKISGQALGLTTAGAGSYFLIALATGGKAGLKLAWEEAKDDPVEFLLDSLLYTMFAGPFGALLRLTQNQSRNRFESLIRMTWPGAIAVEITDMMASTGRYRDREFWGLDGQLMRFTDRFMPIGRMFWQGLAVVGIGSEQQELRTTIMAYWRARQAISPVLRSQRGEPEIAELKEAFEQDRQFRIQMRLAYDAIIQGDNPQEFINTAFATDLTKTRGDIAGSIRRRKLLTGKFADQSSIEFQALRSRLGDDGILILRQHDALIDAVAQSIKPKNTTVLFRPVPQRTLSGVSGRYRR